MDKTVKSSNHWLSTRERGSSWTMHFMVWLCKARYRWLVDALLYPIAGYFFLSGRKTRAASRLFFERATGHFTLLDHYRQLLCFARSLVDRVSILMGESTQFSVRPRGREQLVEARKKSQGLILLGAHLGNFEACQILVKDRAGINVHIVAYFGGSQKIRGVLDTINPELTGQIIDPTQPDAVLRMRDVIESGGILAILGDRTGIGEKSIPVNFLSHQTRLPAGPYLLASILKCPIYCFFGLRVGPFQYDTYVSKLADSVVLPREDRLAAAQTYAQTYADMLADKAKAYPYNWFNFYDFWFSGKDAE